MPSFNQAQFLEEAITSILDQRDQIHEFIVLDGGSTDGSVEIIEKYASEINHWQSKPDGGQSNAIADGFSRVTGDVINWINSDDAILPGAIYAIRERFAADEEIGLVEGNTVIVDAESNVIRCDRRAGPTRWWVEHGYLRSHQPSTFFRRELYNEAGGVDRELQCTMDTDLWYRLIPRTKCVRMKRYIGVHRVHDDAKGESWGEVYRHEREMLDQRYPKLRKRPIKHQIGRVAYYATQALNGR
ncbi:MAG: glycosyltransferase family 2 protein, partial [Phycisphaerales bacterium]|nr:glycosyltransferase family 2 protein [Phycisphaerales bacterium]